MDAEAGEIADEAREHAFLGRGACQHLEGEGAAGGILHDAALELEAFGLEDGERLLGIGAVMSGAVAFGESIGAFEHLGLHGAFERLQQVAFAGVCGLAGG